jgi:outer membrane protein
MRKIWLTALLAVCLPRAADAQARKLSLADAVALALAADPALVEAYVAKDRSKLAVLRAQLDRVSLVVGGSLTEQWNKSNIGGAPSFFPQCNIPMIGALPLDQGTCAGISVPGTTFSQTALPTSPEQGLGLFNLSANLQVPIFSGFRVDATVKRAQAIDTAQVVGIRQQRKDTALATARAYWAVRRLGLLYEVQQAGLERLRESESVTKARVDAGLAPPIDHNRAVLRRLQTEAGLADLSGQVREAAVQLAVALGIADDVELVDVPEVPDSPPPAVGALLQDAQARPELQAARLQLEAQHQAIRIAKSNYYPQVGAQLLFQFGNNPFIPGAGSYALSSTANPFAGMSGNLTLGLGASWNFFDTLHTYTGTKDARYEEARLLQEERRAGRVVESDVRTAHAKVNHLFSERLPLVEAREVARDNAVILEARYKNGDALVIEFLDAQVALVDAERALADVTAQLQLAWLELDASLGKVVGARP